MDVQIKLIDDLDAEERAQLDAMEKLCFPAWSGGVESTEHKDEVQIEWSGSHWAVLGKIDGRLVSQVGLIKREVKVGGVPVWVGGVGGVMTHPAYQRQGLAATLLAETAVFMARDLKVDFGMLVCSHAKIPYYEKSGYRLVNGETRCASYGKTIVFPEPVMVSALSEKAWPDGPVDMAGLPW